MIYICTRCRALSIDIIEGVIRARNASECMKPGRCEWQEVGYFCSEKNAPKTPHPAANDD